MYALPLKQPPNCPQKRRVICISHIRYKKETEVVTFQGKEITLENLSPVFTPE